MLSLMFPLLHIIHPANQLSFASYVMTCYILQTVGKRFAFPLWKMLAICLFAA